MTDTSTGATQIVAVAPPARPGIKEWLPVISTLVVLAGLLLTGGGLIQTVKDTALKVEKLEKRADLRDDQLRDVQVKIGGMDAKLDILVGRQREPRP
jgi:hypothetical protein